MNLIIANLKTLKDALLPSAQAADTTFDAALQLLGKGVAVMMENYCSRKFARVVGDTHTTQGGAACYVLPRFPIESLSAVAVKYAGDDTFTDALDLVDNWNGQSGIIEFSMPLGTRGALVKFTSTGGFWIDESEDNDGELPEGATQMPADIVLAWTTQCQDIFTKSEAALRRAFTPSDTKTALGNYELSPMVKDILGAYRRLSV